MLTGLLTQNIEPAQYHYLNVYLNATKSDCFKMSRQQASGQIDYDTQVQFFFKCKYKISFFGRAS